MPRVRSPLLALIVLASCATPPSPKEFVVRGVQPEAESYPIHDRLTSCGGQALHGAAAVSGSGVVAGFEPWMETRIGGVLRKPVDRGCLSSGFMAPRGRDRVHAGVDYASKSGGGVYAAAAGVVSYAGWRKGYGYTVEIDHGERVKTRYAHLKAIDAKAQVGSSVRRGDYLGGMGATGTATGVHLHYEVWVAGVPVDPLRYDEAPLMADLKARRGA